MKKIILGSIVAASLAFAAAPCCGSDDANSSKPAKSVKGCNGNCDMNMKDRSPLYCFQKAKLNLTKDQEAKLAEISKKYKTQIAEAPKAFNVMPMQFVKDGKFDKDAFIAKHNEVTANVAKVKANMFEEAYSVLDDKQKAKLADFMK